MVTVMQIILQPILFEPDKDILSSLDESLLKEYGFNDVQRRDEKRPTRDDLHIFYPNRGERLKSERTEAESIYNIFKEKLEIEIKAR